jgi:hypothetical protein
LKIEIEKHHSKFGANLTLDVDRCPYYLFYFDRLSHQDFFLNFQLCDIENLVSISKTIAKLISFTLRNI